MSRVLYVFQIFQAKNEVFYLHGLPGLFGGIAAPVVVSGINFSAQLTGILATIIIAATVGLISGKVITVLGGRAVPYVDSEELEGESPFLK